MRIAADWLAAPETQAVCAMLLAGGRQALFVGGCVRNALMGRPVADIDIATDARPDQVMALAEAAGLKPVPTGVAHGTVTVVAGGRPFEVTTFRRDVETDGRRAKVAFTDEIAEDAARRDFTMNALYARPDGVVVDPLGGLPDLRAGPGALRRRSRGADRRGPSAHPALLPHPRLVRRPRRPGSTPTASPPAPPPARASPACRASGSGPR